MIFRVATTWSVIAALLICPFLCLANSVGSYNTTPGGHHNSVSDDCCPSSGPTNGDRPSDNNSSNPGGACLCHGAVLYAHFAAGMELQEVPTSWISGDGLTSIEVALLTSILSEDRNTCHFPSIDSGREVRALIESFLC